MKGSANQSPWDEEAFSVQNNLKCRLDMNTVSDASLGKYIAD